MAKYSLADIKADIDKQFAPLTLDLGKKEVVLRNVMRVSDAEREAVRVAQEKIEALSDAEGSVEEKDMGAYKGLVVDILATVATDGDALREALGEDLALVLHVLKLWSEETQSGEAKSSPEDSTASEAS